MFSEHANKNRLRGRNSGTERGLEMWDRHEEVADVVEEHFVSYQDIN